MKVEYTVKNRAGCVYNYRVENVKEINDVDYPPGGTLRLIINHCGQVMAGPMIEELLSWKTFD